MMTARATRFASFLMLALCCARVAAAQGTRVDYISFGPVAVHDHVRFDLHLKIRNDPYPHETKEAYDYDGVDWEATMGWHWAGVPLITTVRATPVARLHPAYDQDTDFEPGNNFTHGNAGQAPSRTFALEQQVPLTASRGLTSRRGALRYDFTFLRQWTRYRQVTTYDLNSNPSLPSNTYSRLISEQAIVYELRSGVTWNRVCACAGWTTTAHLGVVPLTAIFLHNYIPVVLAATSELAYGATAQLGVGHRLGAWRIGARGEGGWFHGYSHDGGFQRREYGVALTLTLPPFW